MGGTMDVAALLLLLLGVVLQIFALKHMSGGWRVAAWVPAVALGAAILIAVLGVMAGSDLAPIWVVLALPVCFAWLVGLWIVYVLAGWLTHS